MASPSKLKLLSGFAAIYFIWGSTFLAIRFALESIPPFFMAGARFLAAGALLCLWRVVGHKERPGRGHWLGSALIGGLLFLGGNGSVVWSEQHVASGLTALVLAVIPLWMVLLDSFRKTGSPIAACVISGLALGIIGLTILLGPSAFLGAGRVDLAGAGVLIVGSFCWAAGSLISREINLPKSHALAAGMQMLLGGALLVIVGFATGEAHRLDLMRLTPRAIICLLYLISFGSVLAFTAYTWLLTVTTPARVSTYAYVNPVVAVLLGWALADEPLTPRTLLATAVIVTAVAMIISSRASRLPERLEGAAELEVIT